MSSRKVPITKTIRARRRNQAEERNATYNQLTTQQKIDRLPPAPEAKKQRAKLLHQLYQETSGAKGSKPAETIEVAAS